MKRRATWFLLSLLALLGVAAGGFYGIRCALEEQREQDNARIQRLLDESEALSKKERELLPDENP